MSKWGVVAALGFELTGIIVGAVFLGQFLDHKFASKGLITGGLIALSFFAWMFHAVKALKPK